MGGLGSGRWLRKKSKKKIENQLKIDIRVLKKLGSLKCSPISMGLISWSRNQKLIGAIRYRMNTKNMVLNYQNKNHDENWEAVEQRITFDRTGCNLGGQRMWFLCPQCFRRVAILYAAGKYFLCRHCCGFLYKSQLECLPARMLRKAHKIRSRLDRNDILINPFPQKPKNMHWKTYYRLREKSEQANTKGLELWVHQIEKFKAML